MSDFKKAVLFGAVLGAIWSACYNVAHAGVVATTTNQNGGLIRFHDDPCMFRPGWFQLDSIGSDGGQTLYGCWKWGGRGILKAFYPFKDGNVPMNYTTQGVVITPYGNAVFKGNAE